MDPLFCRDVGDGHPIIVVHGGPDFDHGYFLPELDRLADSFRLLYYDQRGRGRSAEGVRPEDVTLRSELDDLDRVRSRFGLESVAVLGHSWGGVLAMEYAIRHPDRVSQLLLMDTGPASAGDWQSAAGGVRPRDRPAEDRAEKETIAATDAFPRGDVEAEAAYYRAHFRMTLRRAAPPRGTRGATAARNFTEGSRPPRADDRAPALRGDVRLAGSWDLLPRPLTRARRPNAAAARRSRLHPFELAARIADAVPGRALTVLPGCGHFTYLEAPELVLEEISRFCGLARPTSALRTSRCFSVGSPS